VPDCYPPFTIHVVVIGDGLYGRFDFFPWCLCEALVAVVLKIIGVVTAIRLGVLRLVAILIHRTCVEIVA
jgi:hypothetical protein